jgi:putative ATP-binding cassette transporter
VDALWPAVAGPIGINVTIPGYMAWVALIYAFLGTFLANLVGRRLINLNFLKQRYEANFRFSLVRVRENAEGIALYNGEQREADQLNQRFADIFANGWRVLLTQAQLAFYQSATSSSRSSSPTW